MGKPVRIPVAVPMSSRTGAYTIADREPSMFNCFVDKYGESYYAVDRPGCVLDHAFTPGTGQGLAYFNGFTYPVIGDVLYRSSGAMNAGTDGTAFTAATTPGWTGRTAHQALVFKGRLWVLPGRRTAGTSTANDIWSTIDGVTWVANAGTPPWAPRYDYVAYVFNNKLWIAGGFDGTAYHSDVWSSEDVSTWTLETPTAAWIARSKSFSVVANNGMYLMGGDNGAVTYDDVWFSIDGKVWQRVTTAAWGGRTSAKALYFKNKIYVIGGISGAFAFLNDVWSSPDGTTWTQETAGAFASARAGMGGCVYNDKMWIVGGSDGAALASVYTSATGTGAWTLVTGAPGWAARITPAAVVFRTPTAVSAYHYETIYVLGGDNVTFYGDSYRGTLNVALTSSYALSPAVASQPFQLTTFLNGQQMLVKNQSNLWLLAGGTLTKVVDNNYPSETVPGLVVLGSFVHVMTPEGEIRSCAVDDATTWPGLNFITADYEDDPGVALWKHLNYVVAFGQYTTQFFYDAGNPTASPLTPYLPANMRIGCANAATIAEVASTLCWVGQSKDYGIGVYSLQGLQAKKVSTPWVDKILETAGASQAIAVPLSMAGHSFYVLQAFSSIYWLVYDITMGEWYKWARADSSYYAAVTTAFSTKQVLMLHGTNGSTYIAATGAHDDAGTPFLMQCRLPRVDFGNTARKFYGRAVLVGDQNAGSVTLQYSDDDEQNFVSAGAFDSSVPIPQITRLGSSARRSWQLISSSAAARRWEALEITVDQGER